MDFDFTQQIILEDERVQLAPMKREDVEELKNVALQDPSIFRYSLSQITDAMSVQHYVENALAERESKFRYPFVLFDKQQNKIAGSTSMAAISNKDKRLEIGWTWLGPSFQRSGLNRHCKYLLLQYAFEQLEFERVELKTDERNMQSRTAIANIGGQQEGIFRSHSLMPDGHRRNTVYFSILKNEWPLVKQKLIR
ncbi:MAG: GNAT family N-acetyltransferase [Chitinophagaceae bacterium]